MGWSGDPATTRVASTLSRELGCSGMTLFSLTPILAAPGREFYRILFLIVVAGLTVAKKIIETHKQAERNKKAANSQASKTTPARTPAARTPAVNTPADRNPEAPPRRDNQFRNEIEVFLEEVGRRRSSSEPPQRAEVGRGAAAASLPTARPMTRPQPAKPVPRPAGPANPTKAEPPKAVPQVGPPRPGAEIASRKAPVSEDLGAQIRAHLGQYLESSRMSQQARTELGKAVELAVREHMGTTETRGAAGLDQVDARPQSGQPIAALLRNPAGVRTAILVNEILERPKCLRRKA
jgi:hypothetical protein